VTTLGADRPFPILLYHSLTAKATRGYRPYAVDPGRFREQMEMIAASGYQTLTMRDHVANMDDPLGGARKPRVLITFDDGFDDVHREAMPVLARLGLKATAFVVTGHVDGTSRWLTGDGEGDRRVLSWTQLRELAAAGVEIGSHSHTHPQLDTLPKTLADEEIVRSRSILEDRLQVPVTSFAYPYGYHSARIKSQLREHGYVSGCAVKNVLSHDGDDRLALGRAVVFDETPTDVFAAWLDGRGLPVAWSGERPQTIAWRLVRGAVAKVRRRPTVPNATSSS
jgi:peptidoglycan/xylan/chitin deacetylase (PgdA/CDA1 family)